MVKTANPLTEPSGPPPTLKLVSREPSELSRSKPRSGAPSTNSKLPAMTNFPSGWRATVLTIFPEMLPGPLAYSLAGKALKARIWQLETVDIRDFARDYWTGTVYTTNRRVWEHDEEFKEYLRKVRAMAIDMETATIFTVGFANEIPTGALLLVSDQPMISTGIKTEVSDHKVTSNFVEDHLKIGIEALREIKENGVSVKHLRF